MGAVDIPGPRGGMARTSQLGREVSRRGGVRSIEDDYILPRRMWC